MWCQIVDLLSTVHSRLVDTCVAVFLPVQELFIEALAAKSAKRTLADQRILLAYNDVGATRLNSELHGDSM